ncbi:MAG TPA: hypothetical protein PKY82_11170 [Pyrinomonadaceae bacterium]|nr:hypothetical protein [Pyrinomonadaceae bacterium]
MKKIIFSFFFVLAILTMVAQAQNSCANQSIENLANKFAKAFQSKTLSEIDSTKPFVNLITIRIENSLSGEGDPDQFEFKRVKSFTLFEKWLKGKEVEELPNRSVEPLISCKKGICTYAINGLLHNTLFLKKISYGYKKDKCPYIKSVFIIDGN